MHTDWMVVIVNTFVVARLITTSERMTCSVEVLYAGRNTPKTLVSSAMRIIRAQTGNRHISPLYYYESYVASWVTPY